MNKIDSLYIESRDLESNGVIGSGQSGLVYRVYDKIYKREFALKSIPLSKYNPTETEFLMELSDQSIVKLYSCEIFKENAYLLFEYCPQSLVDFREINPRIHKDILYSYLQGVLKCVKACHDANIAHLDIKPANFLVDGYQRVKLCDFGLAIRCERTKLRYGGSLPFIAPEILEMKPYDPKKADIFSVGVTFFFLVTGTFPWDLSNSIDLCKSVLFKKPRLEYINDRDLFQIISECLSYDPKKRPTVDELLKHPIFSHVPVARSNLPQNFPKLTSQSKIIKRNTLLIKPKASRLKI